MKKIISLVSAMCVFLIGIAMIIVAFTGAELPKPLWLLFAVCNLVNAFLIITNYKEGVLEINKKTDKKIRGKI